MLPFKPYPKIAERIGDWRVDDAIVRVHNRIRWIATEKVHGANLCVYTDGDEVAVASRRRPLGPRDEFFDFRDAIGPLLPAIRALFALTCDAPTARAVYLYGELFGGAYPHEDIAATGDRQPVQTGVYYCPDVRFAAFDLAILERTDDDEALRFVPAGDAAELLDQAHIPGAPVLGVGTLGELLELPVRFLTRVPDMFDLPPLPDNWAEGMVIRPVVDAPTGSGRYQRPILKRKQPAFAETRYHEARPRRGQTPGAGPASALDDAERLALAMVTPARVHSAISKVGRLDGTADRDAEVLGEMMRDIRAEMEATRGGLLLSLARDEVGLLWSIVEDAARGAIAEHAGQSDCDSAQISSA